MFDDANSSQQQPFGFPIPVASPAVAPAATTTTAVKNEDWSLMHYSSLAAPESVQPNAYFESWVNVADFLLFRGAEFFETGFSAERKRFNPTGKLMMVLSYPAHLVSGPLVVDRGTKVTFETLLSALVQFARLTSVVAVQYDRLRCVYILGPAMERMYHELMALPEADKNPHMHNFRLRYENAKTKALRALFGAEEIVPVYPDLARFPNFKPPARLAVSDGGKPLCCFYVHDIAYEACASGGYAYMLDLGCAICAPDANTVVRLSMPDAFLQKHLAVQKTTEIVYDPSPDNALKHTVRIGPVFLHRYASPEEARGNLLGKVAVTLSLERTTPMSITATTHVSLDQKRTELQTELDVALKIAADTPPDQLAQQIVYRDDASLVPITSGMGAGAGGGEPSLEDYKRLREAELETLRLAASNGTLFVNPKRS